MDTSTDQQGLVRYVKIKLGSRNSQKEGNDTKTHIIERPVQKVVILLEGVIKDKFQWQCLMRRVKLFMIITPRLGSQRIWWECSYRD